MKRVKLHRLSATPRSQFHWKFNIMLLLWLSDWVFYENNLKAASFQALAVIKVSAAVLFHFGFLPPAFSANLDIYISYFKQSAVEHRLPHLHLKGAVEQEQVLRKTMSCGSERECDTDFLGTTGRREVQLAHKQEMAGATTQWDFLFIPSPACTSHQHTSAFDPSNTPPPSVLPSADPPPHSDTGSSLDSKPKQEVLN